MNMRICLQGIGLGMAKLFSGIPAFGKSAFGKSAFGKPAFGMASSGKVSYSLARAIVFGVLLLSLAMGLFLRFGQQAAGMIVIRNDSRETLGVRFVLPDSVSQPPLDAQLEPGGTLSTTFRKGSILEAWPGRDRPNTPARWRLDAAEHLITLELEQFSILIQGQGATIIDLSTQAP